MSFLSVTPDAVTSAAGNLETIGSALNSVNAAAATGTTGMVAMAADDVSAAVQSMFATYAQGYQTASAQAAAFHRRLVEMLRIGASAYLGTEANALQAMKAEVAPVAKTMKADAAIAKQAARTEAAAVAPAQAILRHPLIGTGSTTGTTGGIGQDTGGGTTAPGSGTTDPSAPGTVPTAPESGAVAPAPAEPVTRATATITDSGAVTVASDPGTATTIPAVTDPGAVTVASDPGTATTIPAVTDPGTGGTTNFPVVDVNTPFGPIQATLSQTALPDGNIGWTGSVELPRSWVLGVDALGAPASATAAFHSSVAAFNTAVQTGHPIAAVDALARTPYNVANGFVYGQTSISQPLPAPPGYGSAHVSVPLGGLLAPARPVTVTLVPTEGTPTVVRLDGVEFGGLASALLE